MLEISGRAVVAFPARNHLEARQLPTESWFVADLSELRSNGKSLWDGKAPRRVRKALPAEVDEFNRVPAVDDDELTLVFLVPLDLPPTSDP